MISKVRSFYMTILLLASLSTYIMTIIHPGVKVPIAVLGAEFDQVSPPELVKQFEDILATKPEVLCSAYSYLS